MTDTHDIIPEPKAEMLAPDARHEALDPISATALRMLESAALEPSTVQQVLDFLERSQRLQAQHAYTSALVALRRDLPTTITHDKVVDYPSSKGRVHYTHLSLHGLLEAVGPMLEAHGFALTFGGAREGAELLTTPRQADVTVTATLTHIAGHSHSVQVSAPPDSGSGRNAIQAVASTTTYLRRYAASMILGIATADMPDPDAPEPVRDPGRVDVRANQEAAAWMERNGLSVSEAEDRVGRGVVEWTEGDRGTLRAWAREQVEGGGTR